MIGNRADARALLLRFLRDDRGATAIEYGLMASMIAIAVIASAMMVGGNLFDLWEYVRSHVVDALAG